MARRRRRAITEETLHGLQSHAQNILVAPQGRLACGKVVGPVSDESFEVVRASSREKSVACVPKMTCHGWIVRELGVRAKKLNLVSVAFPRGDVKVTDFSSTSLV